eukprot:4743356-Pyramimonas_sp.AAC.1
MMRLPRLVACILLGLVSVVSGIELSRFDVPILLHADLVSNAMDVLEQAVRAKGYTNVVRLEHCFQTTAICRNGSTTAECVRARECKTSTFNTIESTPLVPGSLLILELDPSALVRAAGTKNIQWDPDPAYMNTEQRLEALLARDAVRVLFLNLPIQSLLDRYGGSTVYLAKPMYEEMTYHMAQKACRSVQHL